LAFLAKTEPRQLKSLGTDAFIASGSFLNQMYCDKGVRSRQKKLVAHPVAKWNLSFTALFDFYLHEKATTDLRSGKVTKIKLSALFRTLFKNKVATITISTPVLLLVGEANQTE
jgi:hypothetical protein